MYYRFPKGFTLIEVLISLILLSFILFGFDAMEIYGLRTIRSAYYFHAAAHQLISMTQRLRAMGQSISIKEEVDQWNLQNQQLLPAGVGYVEGSFPQYQLILYWGEKSHPCQKIQLGQSGCIFLNLAL